MSKKEITCVYKGSPMKLLLKGKDGKTIDYFSYGRVISEDDFLDKKLYKESYEKGRIRSFINKGWIIDKKVNVKGAIVGEPVIMEKLDRLSGDATNNNTVGVTSNQADAYAGQKDPELTMEEAIEAEAAKIGAKIEKPGEAKKADTPKVKKGIPKKATETKEIKPIAEVEQPKTEDKAPDGDDFL